MSIPMLELKQVSRQFGPLLALNQISLRVQPGERVALVGPSGAGKTTLLSLIGGALRPSSGEVWVLGENLSRLNARRQRRVQRQIGMVYQQHHLIGNLAAIHNVNAGHLGRWPLWKAVGSLVWPQEVETARQALAQVGLAEKLYARTERLSGGQQQRLALARVLVQNPALILADEPVASVDPARSHNLMQHLQQLTDKTLIVSLHDVALALRYCDRVVGLRQGEIYFDQPSTEVSPGQLATLYALDRAA